MPVLYLFKYSVQIQGISCSELYHKWVEQDFIYYWLQVIWKVVVKTQNSMILCNTISLFMMFRKVRTTLVTVWCRKHFFTKTIKACWYSPLSLTNLRYICDEIITMQCWGILWHYKTATIWSIFFNDGLN